MRTGKATVIPCMVWALGCGPGSLEPELTLGAAFLEFPPDHPVAIVHPSAVSLGQPFMLQVTTYGSSCDDKGTTRVGSGPGVAVVEPFDYFAPVSRFCPGEVVRSFVHEVELRALEGPAFTARVIGRSGPRTAVSQLTVVRQITVQ